MFDLYCRIIVMGSFAIALIMNFEKNKWKMLKKNLTLFWPRNKATFIQLPDAEKNEVSTQFGIITQIIFCSREQSGLFHPDGVRS